jgi:hypothetical protein
VVVPAPLPPAPTHTGSVVAPVHPPALPSAPPGEIADDAPLRAGLVAFEGMVRPVKGGLEVRSVVLDESLVRNAMTQSADGLPSDPDWFLGARVRVVATLVFHQAGSARGPNGEIMQLREGPSFEAKAPVSIELRKNAETIEGILGPSKGMFQLAGHLISREDLGWSLAGKGGAQSGDRVRLRGQSRTYVCPPMAQCLTSGVLPLFDVARAERLP